MNKCKILLVCGWSDLCMYGTFAYETNKIQNSDRLFAASKTFHQKNVKSNHRTEQSNESNEKSDKIFFCSQNNLLIQLKEREIERENELDT